MKMITRPEEAVQSALEKYVPPIFAVLGPTIDTQRFEGTMVRQYYDIVSFLFPLNIVEIA